MEKNSKKHSSSKALYIEMGKRLRIIRIQLNYTQVLQRILFDAIICRIRKIKISHF